MEKYYYRPLKRFNGRIWKCAGHGAEDETHRAFWGLFYADNRDNDARFLPGCLIVEGYKGDQITTSQVRDVKLAPGEKRTPRVQKQTAVIRRVS